MPKKIISLNIDEKVYSEYSKRCKDAGIIISRQIENFMKKEVENEK